MSNAAIETQPDRKIMAKRRGRPPKNEKRNESYRLRLNAKERQILEQISEQTEQPKSYRLENRPLDFAI